MSGLALGDRLKTVAVTVVVTSIGWLAFGGPVMDSVGNLAVLRKVDSPRVEAKPGGPPTSEPVQGTAARSLPRARAGDYLIPVRGVRAEQLSDTFTAARGGGTRAHDSIDIMAPRGTPVLAAAEGTLEKLFTSRAGGLTIYVRSADRRTINYYAHLEAYAPGLAEKQRVRAGQQLGTVGSTGNADPAAPHLHFEIMQTTPDAGWWEPATAINPYPVLTRNAR